MADYVISDMVPTTFTTDIQQLYQIEMDDRLRQALVAQYRYLNTFGLAINRKRSAAHYLQGYVTGESYFSSVSNGNPERAVTMITVDFGALPNAGNKTVAHGITFDATTMLIRFNSSATNTAGTSMIPLPFSSPTLNENIRVEITTTNISITTAIDYSDYIKCYVDIYYISR